MLDHKVIDKYHQGMSLDAYKIFGAHFDTVNGVEGVTFSVWAPEAFEISVVGTFNNWDPKVNKMSRYGYDGSIWTCFIPGVKEFDIYKYRIRTKFGEVQEKSDPYAFFSEMRPGTASKVYNMEGFPWSDGDWMNQRTRNFDRPMNIYEAHIGSWKLKKEATKTEDGEFYSYEEIAKLIIPYVKEMGYTHIELMPLQEHPFDGSWGYQVTGYFSATSRYGNPKQLMHFIETCHKEGIGVIVDFVPVHFVKNANGLYEFGGSKCYGYPDNYRRYSEWDTVYFDLGREEVRSFMMSCADFWARYFHIDGIRFDAISNLIFWKGNKNLGVNDGAIDFLKRMNFHLHEQFPSIMTIAEDSSDYQGVTKPTVEGGIGFDYKWDLGWMNDTLKYMSRDPIYRQYHHNDMTWSMAYFYNEKFILPFSHDEVVHSKGTIIDKIHGDFDAKFAQLKTLYSYMYGHPGKKLNFMGNELGEFKEWDEKKSLGWNILKFPTHDAFHHYIKDLNKIYKDYAPMYGKDYIRDGFKWMIVDNHEQSLFAFARMDDQGNTLITVMNFTKNSHTGLRIPVPTKGNYVELINSDRDIYGGTNKINTKVCQTVNEPWVNEKQYITIDLGSYASCIFKLENEKEVVVAKEAEPKKAVGRPKKVVADAAKEVAPVKKTRGRPKKVVEEAVKEETAPKKTRGRPKKVNQ